MAVSGLVWAVWDFSVVLPAATFGLLATVIQVVAVALLKSGLKQSFGKLMWRWSMGMGLRLVGVGLFAVAVTLHGDRFPAIPTAIGYVGVLLPLMLSEMRIIR
jgi:hypothetical protein